MQLIARLHLWLVSPFRRYREAQAEVQFERRRFSLILDLWEALLEKPRDELRVQALEQELNAMLQERSL